MLYISVEDNPSFLHFFGKFFLQTLAQSINQGFTHRLHKIIMLVKNTVHWDENLIAALTPKLSTFTDFIL